MSSEKEIHRNRRRGALSFSANGFKYRGVWPASDKRRHRGWCAAIWLNGKRKRLGYFYTAREAALAYDAAARIYYGRDAFLNFPGNGEKAIKTQNGRPNLCPSGHDLTAHGSPIKDTPYIRCKICNALSSERARVRRLARQSLSH